MAGGKRGPRTQPSIVEVSQLGPSCSVTCAWTRKHIRSKTEWAGLQIRTKMSDRLRSTDQGALAAKLAAIGIAGTTAGVLAFVSFVGTRTNLQLMSKDPDFNRKLFPVGHVRLPNGNGFVAPLAVAGSAAHVAAATMTGQRIWAVAGTILLGLLPYNKLVLGHAIKGLVNAAPEEVEARTKRLCRLHHLRVVAAAAAFGVGLHALTAARKV